MAATSLRHYWSPKLLRTLLTSIAATSVLMGAAIAENPKDLLLSPKQVKSDIALAKEAYQRIHPGYDRYTSIGALNTAWDAISEEAAENGQMTVGEFYLEVQKVLTLIRCDHTKAALPKSMKDYRLVEPVYLPVYWQLVEGRGFVVQSGKDVDLAFGDEIISVDGRPLSEMIAQVETYVPYDGRTVWTKKTGIADSLEFMGGAVDHFGALLWSPKPTAEITIREQDGTERTQTVNRINYEDYKKLRRATPIASDFKDSVTFERIGDSAAYLRIDTFVNYRSPVEPDSIYDPIFKAIQKEKRETLILDLRNNGGGSNDAQMRLTAHLVPTKIKQNKDLRVATLNMDGLREHLWTWDKRALNPNPLGFRKNDDGTYSMRAFVSDDLKAIKPDKYVFKGQLIILTSNTNSSASTSLTALLKEHRDAVLVGEQTGGSAEGPTAGLQFTLTLPESGVSTRIPFIRYYNNLSEFQSGLGVSPDIEAPMTVEAFFSGSDPALEKAKSLLE